MSHCRARVVILALLLVVGGGLRCQDTIRPTDSIASNPDRSATPNIQDTPSIRLATPQAAQTTTVKKEHSATKALLWSLLPGAGQVYNRQAWKIPIIYGAFAGVGYFIYSNGTNMRKFKTEYLYRVNNDGATQLAGYANYPTSNIYNMYQSYNQYFQLSIIIGAVVYGLNLIDAYVFGHLFDYDISDDISLRAVPTMLCTPEQTLPSAPGLSLTLTF